MPPAPLLASPRGHQELWDSSRLCGWWGQSHPWCQGFNADGGRWTFSVQGGSEDRRAGQTPRSSGAGGEAGGKSHFAATVRHPSQSTGAQAAQCMRTPLRQGSWGLPPPRPRTQRFADIGGASLTIIMCLCPLHTVRIQRLRTCLPQSLYKQSLYFTRLHLARKSEEKEN